MSYLVDPIKVQEAQVRLRKTLDLVRAGDHASEALLWFAEYANAGPKKRTDGRILEVRADLVASATPRASAAQSFVKAAAAQFEEAILASAIEMAQAAFSKAEAERRK